MAFAIGPRNPYEQYVSPFGPAPPPVVPTGMGNPAAMGNDAASLRQRYGNAPETVPQWNTMNGFDRPQQPWTPVQGNPTAPAGSPLNPNGPAPQPTAPQGGGTDYNSYLQGLIGKASAYDPTAGINDAFRQMREYVGQQTVGDATAQMGARGLLPSDNTSQDLKAVLMGRAMNPIAVQHAQALSNAGQQGLQNQMSLAGLLSDARRQDQAQSWQQQQHEYQKQQDALNNQWRQQQANSANQQWQSQFDWQRQQATTQNVHGGVTDPQGNPIAPNAPGAGQGPAEDPNEAVRAFIRAGSGGIMPGGGGAPAGGGGGGGEGGGGGGARLVGGNADPSTFGQPTEGWNSGFGRSGDPNRRPFEGPATSTVGTSQNGPTTNGSGTTVGRNAPFSSYTPGAPAVGGGIAGAGVGARGGTNVPNAGSGLFGTPTNSTGATSFSGLRSSSSMQRAPGQVASAPFPGVTNSGTYTTIPPRPPAPAPKRA